MRAASILIVMILSAACDPNRVYEENQDIENRIWYVDSIPDFSFQISESQKEYDISLNIRNTRSYPFQNLYITYFLEDSTGNLLESELVNFQLFEAKSGKPLGKGGIGDVYDHRFPILNKYKFAGPGGYNLRLQQYMRRDSLPEIIAVGVRIDEHIEAN